MDDEVAGSLLLVVAGLFDAGASVSVSLEETKFSYRFGT